MTVQPVAILGAGMVTGVGLSAPAACAAIRCGIDNFQETRFMGDGGEWLLGCEVPLEEPWRGQTKLAKMLARAIDECLDLVPDVPSEQIPLLVNLAERDRPGRLDSLDNAFFPDLLDEVDRDFHDDSLMILGGRVGGAVALQEARKLLYAAEGAPDFVLVAGVDSLLVGPTLNTYLERRRLLSAENSNGFIPGEAAGALLLARPETAPEATLVCNGLGFAKEIATVESEEPQRADGLVQAIKAALAEAGRDMADLDYRMTDVSGEQYGFKEAALALSRVLRRRKEEYDIWHPADCIGEVGAAALPCMLGVALFAARKAYAPGPGILCHLGNDDGRRAALVVQQSGSA